MFEHLLKLYKNKRLTAEGLANAVIAGFIDEADKQKIMNSK